ncbi:hypothetical protein GE21DRAFT_1135408 [Neurospora crassa]|nr:hypothetical protein GE21DRAFT_1135408 [Neurospora crassa]
MSISISISNLTSPTHDTQHATTVTTTITTTTCNQSNTHPLWLGINEDGIHVWPKFCKKQALLHDRHSSITTTTLILSQTMYDAFTEPYLRIEKVL